MFSFKSLFKVAALLTAVMIASCGDGGQSNPPVLTAPSNAFVFAVGVASTNMIAGSGSAPTSCRITNPPAWLTATVAGNGCAISGTATTPLAQRSYTLNASNAAGTASITIAIAIQRPVDRDGNGLIELYTLTQLHNMRYNLSGSSYKTSAADTGSALGCPNAACNGYELMNDLDFDTDGDGQTWSQDSSGNYSLDSGDSAAPYFVIDFSGSGGWQPVGDSNNAFNAIFDGNGYVIRNLAIRRELTDIGLFGVTADAVIRNVGLVNNLSDYTGNSRSNVGGLVGYQFRGSITASYATGNADGGDGERDSAGGLVGSQSGGSITGSYATGNADGGDGSDSVGGLVGLQNGSITGSYATGNADGGDGSDSVGGLVGIQRRSISASYATGNADGGAGDQDSVGGLVGEQDGGSISASLATGNADGGTGDQDSVGGLVGAQDRGGSITGSYATGDADGGDGERDSAGGLVGRQDSSSITGSYATGDADGGDGERDSAGGLVGRQDSSSITASYATGNADGGDENFDDAGGLVGEQDGGSITGSYATGNADGRGSVGGLVGFQGSGGSITASYATGDADGGSGVGGLVGYQQSGNIVASYATGDADGGGRVGGLVGSLGGSIIASYATGNADGGDGSDSVGGLVGLGSGSITGSYATGNADGGDGNSDSVGGLVGRQERGSITGSYATGNADGGDGNFDDAGGLVGTLEFGGISISIIASYSFGSKVGGENANVSSDGTPMPTGVTSAAGLTAANVGSSWNSANDGTLGAWDFGGGAQPPAVVFNDYDGASTGTDYAALFAGYTTLTALISSQRPASSPQIGTATTDIQLNDGDTANSISGNIDLPTAFNGENLTWSVFYDPAPTDSQVSVDNNNSVQVNAAHRSTARTFVLRAVDSNSNIVNDYHLRIR